MANNHVWDMKGEIFSLASLSDHQTLYSKRNCSLTSRWNSVATENCGTFEVKYLKECPSTPRKKIHNLWEKQPFFHRIFPKFNANCAKIQEKIS